MRVDFLATIGTWLFNLRPSRAAQPRSVQFNDSCIKQMGSVSPGELEWHQITEVYAFKKDCFTTDQIRILLGDCRQRRWIEATEDEDGFQELIAELPRRLPGCLSEEEWWRDVALPPFETQ